MHHRTQSIGDDRVACGDAVAVEASLFRLKLR